MGTFTFKLPDIGEGIAEAEIVSWHVKVGDRIEEDQPIADMMTDKATVEMESPVSGVVIAVAGEAGDVVSIGSMLVEIEVEGAGSAEAAPVAKAEPVSGPVVKEEQSTPAPFVSSEVETPGVAEGPLDFARGERNIEGHMSPHPRRFVPAPNRSGLTWLR
jgi:2-oxoisovalerate dehydrogenase E2 component (dihydrolipoyl transacylase)